MHYFKCFEDFRAHGLDEFLELVIKFYPRTEPYINKIEQFIINSGCLRIDVNHIQMGAGVSLSDRVIINKESFNEPLGKFLFIVFHEIAHQFQYKKYGADKMYSVYTGDISVKDGAIFMKDLEIVADEFASRKIREFEKIGLLTNDDARFKSFYNTTHLDHFIRIINLFKKEIDEKGLTTPEEINTIFYELLILNDNI